MKRFILLIALAWALGACSSAPDHAPNLAALSFGTGTPNATWTVIAKTQTPQAFIYLTPGANVAIVCDNPVFAVNITDQGASRIFGCSANAATVSPTVTDTPGATLTLTPTIPTATDTATSTATLVDTIVSPPVVTGTPTGTSTEAFTATPTASSTFTATSLPTDTSTLTPLPTETSTPTATETSTATSTPTETSTPTPLPTPTAPISVFVYTNPPPPEPTALVPTTLLALYVVQAGTPMPGANVLMEQCRVSGSICASTDFEARGTQTMGPGGTLYSPVPGSALITVSSDYYYRFTINSTVASIYIPPGQDYVWQELDVP